VDDRSGHGLGDIGGVKARAGIEGRSGEAHLVVDDNVNRPAGPIPPQLGKVECLDDNALTGKCSIAMPDATELASHRYLRHVGIYALTRAALIRWTALPEGELERIERLEQLRALAAGMRIGVGVVADADGGIDTLDDARRAESRLRERSSRTFQGGAGE
jgi:hypothetical protein